MKTFINKNTKIEKSLGEKKTTLTYSDLVLMALNTAPKEGWTPDEMRKRMKPMDKFEDIEIDATVSLEDAEFDLLKACIVEVRWNFFHKDLVAFDDYIKEVSSQTSDS